jgi:hypothetical protein
MNLKTKLAFFTSLMVVTPAIASTLADDIAFTKRQIKLLEDASIDASEMRVTLRLMEADAAAAAASGTPSIETPPAANVQQQLLGSWSHPVKGTWNFTNNGTGTLVRDSVNGIPGRYTITVNWSQEGTNTLVYTPIRNTLVGSPDSDRDEPIAAPKTYRAPFEIVSNELILGGSGYVRQ